MLDFERISRNRVGAAVQPALSHLLVRIGAAPIRITKQVEVSNEATGITNGTDTRVALVNIQAVVDSTEVDVFDQNHYYLHTGKAVNIMGSSVEFVGELWLG